MNGLAPVVVGWALTAGVDWRLVVLLAALVLLDARRVRRQRGGCSEEAHVLLGVAVELRAG